MTGFQGPLKFFAGGVPHPVKTVATSKKAPIEARVRRFFFTFYPQSEIKWLALAESSLQGALKSSSSTKDAVASDGVDSAKIWRCSISWYRSG